MRRAPVVLAILAIVLSAAALWLAPDALDAAQIYGGVIAIVGLIFLINRKFTDLAVFFLAAILVGWLVFSPDQVADAARAVGDRILP